MPGNILTASELNERLTANPFNRWLGLAIRGLTEDEIEIALPWREELISNPEARNTHGGIIAALIDVAADFMIGAKLGAPVPTVDLRVDFHSAAMPGDLLARGRIVRLGGTNSVAEAVVVDGAGRLIASGRGVYFTAAARRPTESQAGSQAGSQTGSGGRQRP